jgi:MFS family permease
MFKALRIRDFRLLWTGSLISALGSWLLILALPAHVFLVTGSLRDTGLILAAQYLPTLVLGPIAGVFIDRWDRRRVMIATSLFRAGSVAVMLLGAAPGRYWVLYAALIAESAGGVFYVPAAQARTPAIVGTGPVLNSANALNAVSDGAVRLIGGPLGGVLLTLLGMRWLICADTLSYLVSAAAIIMTSRPARAQVSAAATVTTSRFAHRHADRRAVIRTVARELTDGIRVLRAQPVARALLPVTVIFLAANASLSSVLIPFGVQRLGGSEHTGFLLSSLGVGFLLGAPALRALLDRGQPRTLLTVTLTGTAVAYFVLFTSSSLTRALPAAVAIGMFGSMSEVIPQTTMQRVIPNAALGRVSAVFLTGEAAATLLGAVAGPFLAQAVHLLGIAAVASAATLLAAFLALMTIPTPKMSVAAVRIRLENSGESSPGEVRQDMGTMAAPASIEEALAAVHGGLGFLADLDAAELPVEAAAHCVKELVGAESVFTAALAGLLAAVEAKDGHVADGQRSMRAWAVHVLRVTRAQAGQYMAMRALARDHQPLRAGLRAKAVTKSLALQLALWTQAIPAEYRGQAEEILIAAARAGASLRSLAEICAEIKSRTVLPDPDGKDPALDRALFLDTTLDGAGVLRGDMTPECTAMVQAVLDALAAPAGAGDLRTRPQRYHDALEEAMR